jgi:hypothetical protein
METVRMMGGSSEGWEVMVVAIFAWIRFPLVMVVMNNV